MCGQIRELSFADSLSVVAENLRRQLDEQALRDALGQVAEPAPASAVRRLALKISHEVAADQPAEVQASLANYLSFVPAVVRRSLKRPDDPTGTSVPDSLSLSRTEDLVPLLPAGLPRFRPGERPATVGGWELAELLGVSGFGEVWLARRVSAPDRQAVVKFCTDPAAQACFAKQGEHLIRRVQQAHSQLPPLAHGDGIVAVEDVNLAAEPPWVRSEYVDGHGLGGLVLNWASLVGPKRGTTATAVIRRLARIVGQFHRLPEPIVHGYLRPGKIFIGRGPDGKMLLRVSDFGTGQASACQAARGTRTTPYASPRRTKTQEPDVRDDVFALGVLWYQLLVGDLTVGRPRNAWRKRIADLGLRADLLDVLDVCVAEDPAARPGDAAELAERLATKPQPSLSAPPTVVPPEPVVPAMEPAANAPESLTIGPPASTPTSFPVVDLPATAEHPREQVPEPTPALPVLVDATPFNAPSLVSELMDAPPSQPSEQAVALQSEEPTLPADHSEVLAEDPGLPLPLVSTQATAPPTEELAVEDQVLVQEPPVPETATQPVTFAEIDIEELTGSLWPEPAVPAVEAASQIAEPLAGEPPVPSPVSLPVVDLTGPVELAWDVLPEPTPAPPVVADATPVDTPTPARELLDAPPSQPPEESAALLSDEQTVPVKLLVDDSPAPSGALTSDTVADRSDVLAEEPGLPLPLVSTQATAPPTEEVAEEDQLLVEEPPAPETAAQPVTIAEIDIEELAARLWDEPPTTKPPEQPLSATAEAAIADQLLREELPPPESAARPVTLAEVDVEELTVQLWDEPPTAPPPQSPLPAVAEVAAAGPLLTEQPPALEPAAQPVTLTEVDLEEPASRLWDEPPTAPLPQSPLPAPPEVATSETVTVVELPEASIEDPGAPHATAALAEAEESGGISTEESAATPSVATPVPTFLMMDEEPEWVEPIDDEPPAVLPTDEPASLAEIGADEVALEMWNEQPSPSIPPPQLTDPTVEVNGVGSAELMTDEPAPSPPAALLDSPTELAALKSAAASATPSVVPTGAPDAPVPAELVQPQVVETPQPPKPSEDLLFMQFAWVPPGEFLMGNEAHEEERPVRRVTIGKGFNIGVGPVTQFQWGLVMNYNPSRFHGDDRPVEMVSWLDCQEFCRRLREMSGRPFRLPTEAEWEYACRGGTAGEYSTGDGEEALRQAGWFYGNSGGQTHPVGKLAANAWKLHDMHGNVWEWCQDWFAPYAAGNASDPQGPEAGELRVLRGGSWRDPPGGCCSSFRGQAEPASRFFECGFRICFSPE
jgi:formylglycine-generating enzyme required for sulfatase activity/serine/threonine protein kinase